MIEVEVTCIDGAQRGHKFTGTIMQEEIKVKDNIKILCNKQEITLSAITSILIDTKRNGFYVSTSLGTKYLMKIKHV